MVSFQYKFAKGLAARGVEACYDLKDEPYQAILVIGGTRQLAGLWRAKRKGIPIVQRLDGMNWLHRKPVQTTGTGLKPKRDWRHFLRSEYGNLILALLRSRLANRIVYQSEFVRKWWGDVHGQTSVPERVIYNGVDLKTYAPAEVDTRPRDAWRLLMVEGSLMGGYEQGLQVGLALAEKLAVSQSLQDRPVELMVAGKVLPSTQVFWTNHLAGKQEQSNLRLTWAGLVDQQDIPKIDNSAHLLYSADIHPACPNAVIEALACGLPVLSFNTGSLPELVTGDSGRVVDYGGDPWQLDSPDVDALLKGALEILRNQDVFRLAARQRAEEAFDLEKMVNSYLEVLLVS